MARVDFEAFADKEVTRIYLAARLNEATQVERTLNENGVDYAVDIEAFQTLVLGLFPSQHAGVGFYVLSGQADFSKRILLDAGLKAGIEDDEAAPRKEG